jgi:hypothetical protein
MATLKTCFKCGKEKALTEFYKHPVMGDGHLGKCKPCARKDVRQNYADKIEEKRAYDAMRNALPERKKRAFDSFKKSALKHPEREKAKVMTGNAIRDGRLLKHPCWICGEKAEAHHPDYSRPLDVVWLCTRHHRQAHVITRTMKDD